MYRFSTVCYISTLVKIPFAIATNYLGSDINFYLNLTIVRVSVWKNHNRIRVDTYVHEIERETEDYNVSRETRSNAVESNYPYSVKISFAVYYVKYSCRTIPLK